MQREDLVLKKIVQQMEKHAELPITKILDKNQFIIKTLATHPLFKNQVTCEILFQQLTRQTRYNHAFLEKEDSYSVFFGDFGLVYFLKILYLEETFIGTVLLGGYRLKNINYNSNISEELEKYLPNKENDLPPIRTSQEIKKIFENYSLEIDSILNNQDATFLTIFHELRKNFNKVYTLEQLSFNYFISVSKIQRLFHTHLGENFKGAYRKIKLEQAKILHEKSLFNAREILEELGYIDNRELLKEIQKLLDS